LNLTKNISNFLLGEAITRSQQLTKAIREEEQRQKPQQQRNTRQEQRPPEAKTENLHIIRLKSHKNTHNARK